MSATRMTTATEDERDSALEAVSLAIQLGGLVVIPTDTVYGICADAFDGDAVKALLAAKGRGPEMPPPVLISSATTIDALARDVPDYARTLIEEFWPGPLTLVCTEQPSLTWDLGESRGTVAVRMPNHPIALEVLERTGPLAVSSANLHGEAAAATADEAERMLGEAVDVIVDAGRSPGGDASTIVDVRGSTGRLLRLGALSLERLNEALAGTGASVVDPATFDPATFDPASGD